MAKINFNKFNDNEYVINDETTIIRFDEFLNLRYDNDNIDGIINDKIHEFFNDIENIHDRYNREYPNGFSGLNKYRNGMICNDNVINDIMWYCHFTPIDFKILYAMKQNGLNNDNTIVLMFNLSGDENYILFDFERETIYNLECTDKFEIITGYSALYNMVLSLCNDIIDC